MGKIDASRFGSATPKLTPDDIEEAAILTIATFEEADVDDDEAPGGKRHSANLTFEETGDKVLWLNKGMVETLIEQLGDDTDTWTGQKIPVESATVKFRGRDHHKVRVMESSQWDAAFKEAGVKRTRRAEAPAAKKGGRR